MRRDYVSTPGVGKCIEQWSRVPKKRGVLSRLGHLKSSRTGNEEVGADKGVVNERPDAEAQQTG